MLVLALVLALCARMLGAGALLGRRNAAHLRPAWWACRGLVCVCVRFSSRAGGCGGRAARALASSGYFKSDRPPCCGIPIPFLPHSRRLPSQTSRSSLRACVFTTTRVSASLVWLPACPPACPPPHLSPTVLLSAHRCSCALGLRLVLRCCRPQKNASAHPPKTFFFLFE